MFWKNINVDVFDDVLKNAKHRGYDASNDVNRPPLQQGGTIGNIGQQWTAMDNIPRCNMHLWCHFCWNRFYFGVENKASALHSSSANDQGNALFVPEVWLACGDYPLSLCDQETSLVDQVCAFFGNFSWNWSDTKLCSKYWPIDVNPVSTYSLKSTVQYFGKSPSCANPSRSKVFSVPSGFLEELLE